MPKAKPHRVFTIPPPWTTQALCAQADPDAWYPEKGEIPFAAKQICRTCPVQTECLQWALDHDERFGVWGGLTDGERHQLRKEAA